MGALKVVAYSLLILLSLSSLSISQEGCIYTLDNVPYLTFQGQRLPNHGYVDGAIFASTALLCRTDLETCCSESDGPHSGEWILPTGDVVSEHDTEGLRIARQSMIVELRSNGSLPTSGIYRCDVPTNSVNDVGNTARKSVYVGVYNTNSKYYHSELFYISAP